MFRKKFYIPLILLMALPFVNLAQLTGGAFDKYYKNGMELFQGEKFAAAKEEFSKAKGFTAPEYKFYAEELDYYIAACSAEMGSEDAETLLSGFFRKYPNSLRANNMHLLLGNMYQAKGDFKKSLEEYGEVNQYILSGGQLKEFYFNRGYAYFSMGEYEDAVWNFNMVDGDPVLGSSSTYYKAYINYQTGNLDQARTQFTTLLSDRNFEDIAPFYIVHIDFKKKDYTAVVNAADKLMSRATDRRREELLRVAGESYYHLGNYEEALRYLDTYAENAQELTVEELYLTGMSHYMTGDFTKAVDYLGKVAAGDDLLGQNSSFHIGNSYLRSGNKQRAQQAYSLAMKMDYDKEVKQESMFNYAKLQYELGGGMFNETINTVTQYLEEFPDSPNSDEARQYLLAAYLNSHDYAAAYDALMKISNPDNNMKMALQRIAYYRGLEYFTDGDYANAQKMFDIAIANRYNAKITALTRFWMAETYYRQGEYIRAVPLYQEYIALSPRTETENIMANYNLAYCYFNIRNMRESQLWFNRFMELYTQEDGIKADAYNRIGDIHFLGRDYSKALTEYGKAIRIGTSEADYARYQSALALGLTSGASRKIEALQTIINSGRGEYVDDAMYELGSTYTLQEQFSQAASTLRDFISKYPESPYYVNALTDLGLIYQNMGRSDEALDYYKAVVEKYPNSSKAKDALLGIRNIYMDRGDAAGYFDFAASNNMETNAGVVERDSLTFAAAEKIYLSGDTKRAKPLLERYMEQYSSGNYLANAIYYVADANMREGETDLALAGYEKIIAMPTGPFTMNSLLNAAAVNFQKENYDKSADMYRRLSELSQTRNIVADALSGYIRSIDRLDGDADWAISAADYVIAAQYSTDDIRAEAKFVQGKAYLKKGDRAKALPALREVARNVKTRNGSEAEYLVIKILYDTGKFDEAEKEVFNFSETNTSHQYWLGKAFLVLGDVYLSKGDTFQAKATFQSIVDGYGDRTDGIVEDATEKLNSINE